MTFEEIQLISIKQIVANGVIGRIHIHSVEQLGKHGVNNFKLVTELGGELVQVSSSNIVQTIIDVCRERHITTVCIGQPNLNFSKILKLHRYSYFLRKLSEMDIKLIIFPQ